MILKRFLILAPIILTLGLLQSYFWVPTYEAQTKGNPDRVFKFIEASIGDAKILNPILNADTASSRIVGLVFEGLLDLDENLNLRGRLATDWTITETAYLLINAEKRFPDGTPVTSHEVETRIKKAIQDNRLKGLKELVAEIRLVPPEQRTEMVSVPGPDNKPVSVQVRIHIPERLSFTLQRVDQDFFNRLKPILGSDYEKDFPYEKWIDVSPVNKQDLIRPQFTDLLPVFEHNP
ncbi:MAG: hypothetical protein L0Y56_17515, partial [Nitrospira sp.]|nr:hypothetical protein [Nitrospira sp.]